jgi:hypothetical protein
MVGLLDIRVKKGKAKIDDEQEVDVVGLSFDDISDLLERYPALEEILSGKIRGFTEMIKKLPEAAAALVAASTGNMGDPEAERAARRLPMGVQWDIVQAMGRVTFPHTPLAEVVAILNGSTVRASDTSAMNTPKPSLNSTATNIPPSGDSRRGRRPPSSLFEEKSGPDVPQS